MRVAVRHRQCGDTCLHKAWHKDRGSVARQRLTGHMDTCNIQSVHRPEDCIAWSVLSFISLSLCSVANLSLRLIIIGSQVSRLGSSGLACCRPFMAPAQANYNLWSLSAVSACTLRDPGPVVGINVSHRYTQQSTDCQPHAGFTWHCIINKISYFDSTLTSFINWIRC